MFDFDQIVDEVSAVLAEELAGPDGEWIRWPDADVTFQVSRQRLHLNSEIVDVLAAIAARYNLTICLIDDEARWRLTSDLGWLPRPVFERVEEHLYAAGDDKAMLLRPSVAQDIPT